MLSAGAVFPLNRTCGLRRCAEDIVLRHVRERHHTPAVLGRELLGGSLAEQTVETLRARTLAPSVDEGVRVRMTEQGQDIVLRGAAVMVLSGQLGVS